MDTYVASVLDTLNPSMRNELNTLVSTAKEGTFFHSFEWCKILEDYGKLSGNFSPLYALVRDASNNRLVGMMALFLNEQYHAISLPYGDYGGPCLSSELSRDERKVVFETIVDKCDELLKETVNKISIKGLHQNLAVELTKYHYKVEPKYHTFLLAVHRQDKDQIRNIFRRDARRGIKKALDNDIHVERIAHKELLKEYYCLYIATMKKLKATIRLYPFFEILWDNLFSQGRMNVVLAKHQGKYIAGIISFSWNKILHIYGNVSLPESYKIYPNDLIYYETIRLSMEKNCQIIDFGLTPLDKKSGLYQFKERWRGSPNILYSATKTQYGRIVWRMVDEVRAVVN